MLFLTAAHVPELHEYLPNNQVGIVSPLNRSLQIMLFEALCDFTNFTHLLFDEALPYCSNLADIGMWLGSLPNLRHLSLTDTPGLVIGGIQGFFDGLKFSSSLVHLKVSGLQLGPEGAFYVAQLIKTVASISTLDISNNNIQSSGLTYILKCNLRILVTSDNNIHPGRWSKNLECATTSLEKFISRGNPFTDKNSVLFSDWVSLLHLRSLDLSHVDLSGIQLKVLCAAVLPHPTLNVLKLMNCGLQSKDMECIARMLRVNTQLTRLLITQNPIELDGNLFLIWALQKNFTIFEILVDPIDNYALDNSPISDDSRQQPIKGETVSAHLVRLLCINQDLNLQKSFWSPRTHCCYPDSTQQRVFLILLCFVKTKMVYFPIELQLLILSFWKGVEIPDCNKFLRYE